MKIITKIVIDIATGRVEEEDSYEYNGPIMECKGGGSQSTTTTNIDYAYNARMAALSERQQAMSENYFKFWETSYKPMEQAQIDANIGLIPTQVAAERSKSEYEKAQADAAKGLIPEQTALAAETIGAQRSEIAAATPVVSEYYKQALRGVDPNQRVAQAQTDVATSFAGTDAAMMRSMGRYGVGMGSDRIAEMQRMKSIEQAKATGAAMTGARIGAEEENFARLTGASAMFKGGLK